MAAKEYIVGNVLGNQYTKDNPNPSRDLLTNDLRALEVLRSKWNTELLAAGYDPESAKTRNYDPVKARWNYTRAFVHMQVSEFLQEERRQLTTTLRERYSTQSSKLTLSIKDNKLYSDAWDHEPIQNMFWRGYILRFEEAKNPNIAINDKSHELERDFQDVITQALIEQKAVGPSTKVGAKFAVISGPGLAPYTMYNQNKIRLFEVAEDEQKKRFVRYAEFSSSLDYGKYSEIALKHNPDFFSGFNEAVVQEEHQSLLVEYNQYPLDAWFVGHLIEFSADADYADLDALFTKEFAPDVEAMSENEFQTKILPSSTPAMIEYMTALTALDFNPVLVAEKFNALLNAGTDKELQEYVQSGAIQVDFDRMEIVSGADAYMQIGMRLQEQEVRTLSGNCGDSSGFKKTQRYIEQVIESNNLVKQYISNTVAVKGYTEMMQGERCCLEGNNDNHYHCTGCKKKYADETNKKHEERTEKCSCGQQLRCE